MKRKRISILGFLGLISLFLFVPAYLDYEELTEVDLLSPNAKYEDQAREDFSIDKQLNFAIVSGLPSIFSLPGNNPFDSLIGFSLQTRCSDQKPLTLRC